MGRDVGDNTHPPSPRFLGQGTDQEPGAGQDLRCLSLLVATVVRRNGRPGSCVLYGSHDSSVLRATRWIDELLAESCLVESVNTGRSCRPVRRRAYVDDVGCRQDAGRASQSRRWSFKPVLSFPQVPGGNSPVPPSLMRGCIRCRSAEKGERPSWTISFNEMPAADEGMPICRCIMEVGKAGTAFTHKSVKRFPNPRWD